MSNVKGSATLVVGVAAMMMFLTGCETTKHAEVMSAEELARQEAALSGVKSPGAEQGGIPLDGQGLSEGSIAVGDASGAGSGTGSSESSDMSISSISDIRPEEPPLPTLRDVSDSAMSGDSAGGGGPIEEVRDSESGMSDGNVRDSGFGMPDAMDSGVPSSPPMPSPPATSSSPPTPSSPSASIDDDFTGEPSGYEGQQFVRGLTPSDFVPEAPPQPTFGHAPASTDSSMSSSDSADSGTEMSETAGSGTEMSETADSGDEVVQLPDHSGDSDAMEPLDQGDMGGSSEGGSQGQVSGMEIGHVYFDFDQYVIRDDAIPTLQADAQLLNAKYKDSDVLIEGHCDERGTADYNLVLGERRAQAVKNYLVDLGVSSSRISIVSYGKERPSCSVSEEWCWQKNRRGHLVLQ